MADKEEKTLHDVTPCGEPQFYLEEIQHIASMITADFDHAVLEQVHGDIIRLFQGDYQGYKASNTRYHDLEHTESVALAQARILHGLVLQGHKISPQYICLGIIGALFHDTGLILTSDEQEGSGAKYTIGHEERSIRLMRDYLTEKGFPPADIEACTQMINCTILNQSPAELIFSNSEVEIVGKALGSADLLAQMADRNYLAKLPRLFEEFEEGGVPGYDSAIELLEKTEEFYHSVAQRRIEEDLGGVASAVRFHFAVRFGIDRDLYSESIDRNLSHLRHARHECGGEDECFHQFIEKDC